jgi:signal transduction histidine kinase
MNRLARTLRDGVRQITDHPQLWLTIIVAVAIVGSFVYTAYRFSGIAQEAHERLVNVRVGSLQDAFVPLATELSDEPATLRARMQTIAATNPTIQDFLIVTREEEGWIAHVALRPEDESETFLGYDFLLSLAEADPLNSFTIEEAVGGERFFMTARAIPDFRLSTTTSAIRALAVTRQTLSEADTQIAARIRESVVILGVILLILLYLFFRHARIIDYTVLYRRLKEVDQLKDDFISMASHELRTPLTAIRGYADELRTIHTRSADEMEMLSRIDVSAKELDQLIADILDVARIQEGRLRYTMQKIDPHVTVRSVCDALRPIAEQKGISLVENVTDSVRIQADGDRFRQILTNLVGNALKYTEKGEVRVRSLVEKTTLVIRISDTGIGMTADEQKHLFEKFYRAPGRDVQDKAGTGLGLWITKQLIEGMNGTITVESIRGVGSHFIVSFPLSEKGAP